MCVFGIQFSFSVSSHLSSEVNTFVFTEYTVLNAELKILFFCGGWKISRYIGNNSL